MSTLKSVFCFLTINGFFLVATLTRTKNELQGTVKRACAVKEESNFIDVLNSDCFVDRSLFIKDFLSCESRIVPVSAPSGFGKSFNMEILRMFLNNDTGPILHKNSEVMRNGSTFTRECSILKNHSLNVFKYKKGKFFKKHCGKYPVINVNFKGITGSSAEEIIGGYLTAVRKSYREHLYLNDSTKVSPKQKETFSFFAYKPTEDLHRYLLTDGLIHLSEMLYAHFEVRAVILVDDYDAPIWSLLNNTFPKDDVKETVQFMNLFLALLFTDVNYVGRILINSRMRMHGIVTYLDNYVTHYPFLGKHEFAAHYGLNANEVKCLLDKFSIGNMYEEVTDYYNGYYAGHGKILDTRMYNTLSFMKYLQFDDLKVYWVEPEYLNNLDEVFVQTEVRKLVSKMLHNFRIKIYVNENVTHRRIITVKNIMSNNGTCSSEDAPLYIELLLNSGYFRQNSIRFNEVLFLQIPNKEMHSRLYDAFYSQTYFASKAYFHSSDINKFSNSLNGLDRGDNKTLSLVNFKQSVTDLFRKVSKPKGEDLVQGIVYFLVKNSTEFSSTRLELIKNIKVKRVDACVITVRVDDGTGIIIKHNMRFPARVLKDIVDKDLHKLFQSTRNIKNLIYVSLAARFRGEASVCYLKSGDDMKSKICV